MTFNGEEFSMVCLTPSPDAPRTPASQAFRHWTHGYDHYTFRRSVALHPYARAKRPALFWENTDRCAVPRCHR
jgi:hypothetical protein